jgi:hypothetical protein
MWEIDPEDFRNNHYWDHEWWKIPSLLIDNTMLAHGPKLEEKVAKVNQEILSLSISENHPE